jgi:hypothetical protein
VWLDPDDSKRRKVSKAEAKRMKKVLGLDKKQVVPHGFWVPAVHEDLGYLMVPEEYLRPYTGKRTEAPIRVMKGKGSTACGRGRPVGVIADDKVKADKARGKALLKQKPARSS